MNDLQKLIDWAKVQKEKAERTAISKTKELPISIYHEGKVSAFSDLILKAELLLEMQQHSSTQPPLQQADVNGSLPPMADIKRLCDLIVNSEPQTVIKGEIESLAFHIGHHPAVLNFAGGNDS